MTTMTEISPDVTRDVESVLRQKLSNVVTQEYSSAGGVKSLADILNQSDRTTERKGSPPTLVVTKNRASYQRRERQLEEDQGLLLELGTL